MKRCAGGIKIVSEKADQLSVKFRLLEELLKEKKQCNCQQHCCWLISRKDSILFTEKDGTHLLACGIPEEIVSAIMILYKNTKAMVRSSDGDTDFFEIKAGVLQGDTLAPFLFVTCLDCALRHSVDQFRKWSNNISDYIQ